MAGKECLKNVSRAGFVAVLTLLLGGCAGSSVFNPYPSQALVYRTAIVEDTMGKTTLDLAKKGDDADAILYLCERGRLNQLNKDYAASKADFEQVIAAYDANDEKAKISASNIAANASTMLTNDNALPYAGFGYERIFVHQFQAFNYLALGDLEGANVEIRRAAAEQRTQEIAHNKEIAEAESEAGSNNYNLQEWQSAPELSGMNALAGNVKSSFQNAYAFYTSAVLWEAQGDLENALIDYKKALEINSSNTQIQQDIKRVSAGKKPAAGQAGLVVLFEDGFVPERRGFNLSLPYFGGEGVTYLSIAFPYYASENWYMGNTLTLFDGNRRLGETTEIANVGAMAVKALQEKMPAMLIRQMARAISKYQANRLAGEHGGALGSILSTIYNIVSEQADLRSWLTLPDNAQIFRTELPAGEHQIELNVAGASQTTTIKLNSGHITVLRVINSRSRIFTETYNL